MISHFVFHRIVRHIDLIGYGFDPIALGHYQGLFVQTAQRGLQVERILSLWKVGSSEELTSQEVKNPCGEWHFH